MPTINDVPALSIPEGVPKLLRDLVHQRTGLHFEPDRHEMFMEKLRDRVLFHGLRSYLDYYFILKYEEKGAAEWLRVMDAFSVQETYFWREFSQVESLIKFLIPQWFKGNSTPLRVWSAACASGEEPYTIIMALQEAGMGHLPIQVFASDASEAALAKARSGIYRERSFRALTEARRQKYFTRVPEGWLLNSDVRDRVSFSQANLVSFQDIAKLATAPVIFCRNVFIYFSEESVRQTIGTFAERMTGPGHVFLGSSESLLKLTDEFELQELGDAFVYVRKLRRRPRLQVSPRSI